MTLTCHIKNTKLKALYSKSEIDVLFAKWPSWTGTALVYGGSDVMSRLRSEMKSMACRICFYSCGVHHHLGS
jgi:hypothetical protein